MGRYRAVGRRMSVRRYISVRWYILVRRYISVRRYIFVRRDISVRRYMLVRRYISVRWYLSLRGTYLPTSEAVSGIEAVHRGEGCLSVSIPPKVLTHIEAPISCPYLFMVLGACQ